MKRIFFLLCLCLLAQGSVFAEEAGTFTINAHETKAFTYKSAAGQVFEFEVVQGPGLPAGQRGFEFGGEKQSVFCEGKNCTRAGGFLLFCPKAGVISVEMKNLSESKFVIALRRIECEGKDAGTMKCPRASTVKAMCG